MEGRQSLAAALQTIVFVWTTPLLSSEEFTLLAFQTSSHSQGSEVKAGVCICCYFSCFCTEGLLWTTGAIRPQYGGGGRNREGVDGGGRGWEGVREPIQTPVCPLSRLAVFFGVAVNCHKQADSLLGCSSTGMFTPPSSLENSDTPKECACRVTSACPSAHSTGCWYNKVVPGDFFFMHTRFFPCV